MEDGEDVSDDLPELLTTSSALNDSDFVPKSDKVSGNIARAEFRKFWEEELQADIWTMNLIWQGYKLPFSAPPTI